MNLNYINPKQLSNTISETYSQNQITLGIFITLVFCFICVCYSWYSTFMLIPAVFLGATLGLLLSATENKTKHNLNILSPHITIIQDQPN